MMSRSLRSFQQGWFYTRRGLAKRCIWRPDVQAQHTITLYSRWGGVAYVLTYRDTFYWNGAHIRAEKPYWTYWKAWDTRVWSVEPTADHVTNWGRVSFSQAYLNLVLDVPFGGQQNLSGPATMYDNGDWTAAIQQ